MKVKAYIIAGGKSKRMGFDKRSIKINNKTLIEAVAQKAEEVTHQRVTLVGNNLEEYDKYKIIPDYKEEAGPLSGIISALNDSDADWVLILAADNPLLAISDLNRLIETTDPQYDMIAYKSSNGIEPLIAVYNRRILSFLIEKLNRNHLSIRRFYQEIQCKFVLPDDEKRFMNINTEEDLRILKEMKDLEN